MIWTSPPAMTVIDLAVMLFAVITIRYAWTGGFFGRRSPGGFLIVIGVSAYAGFYFVDLLLMGPGPAVFGADQAMHLMAFLHLNVMWIVSLLGVGCTAVGFVLTSRSQARDAERLSLMAEALPLAVAYLDTKEHYRFANRRYASLHGREPADLIGMSVRDVMSPDLYDFLERGTRLPLGGPRSHEYRTRHKNDGELRDLHVDLVPDVGADGRVAGFFLLIVDVTTRVQLERDVVRAAEAERLSIARDLHDGLGQALTGISLALGALARKLDLEGSPQVQTVTRLATTAQETIEQVRRYTQVLAPTLQGGLFNALRTLAHDVSALYEIECTTQGPAEDVEIGPSAALHLYRLAQESVSNAVRHGRAATIKIECRVHNGTFELEVNDDGLGIPPEETRRNGMGLKSMHYRARMIGGSLKIAALADGGTLVSCSAPLASLCSNAERLASIQDPSVVERMLARRELADDEHARSL